MAKYSHITRGGVGTPVGSTVFKTAEGIPVYSLVGSTPIRLCPRSVRTWAHAQYCLGKENIDGKR